MGEFSLMLSLSAFDMTLFSVFFQLKYENGYHKNIFDTCVRSFLSGKETGP